MGSALNGFFIEPDRIENEASLIKRQADINTAFADAAAEDALVRGDQAARDFKTKVNLFVGRQRTATASQNIEVNSGTARQLQDDTLRQGEIDLLTIQNNAYREAWGFKVQAQNLQSSADIQAAGASERADASQSGAVFEASTTAIKALGSFLTGGA